MAKKKLKKGYFITFEGIEGCGKSTQSGLLYEYFLENDRDCIHTREPGGTRLGEKIRELLLHSHDTRISDMAELLLFEASRSQILKDVIIPAMKNDKVVICDRYSDATYAYQGYGGRVDLDIIKRVDLAATGGVYPDLTILLDVDIDTGLKRASRKGVDRMEKKEISYHKRVRAGYLALSKKYPSRIKIINTRGTIDETQTMIRREVIARLSGIV